MNRNGTFSVAIHYFCILENPIIMKKISFLLVSCALALVACTPKPVAPDAAQSLIVEDGGTGPVKVLMLEDPSLEAHTIFAPQDLSAFGPATVKRRSISSAPNRLIWW